MDLTSLVVDGVILLVILAILISVVRAWRNRPARAQLIALPPETRTRYVVAWERIEKRFMDAPEEATSEADSLLLAMLGERGHPLAENRRPYRLRSARRKMAEGRRRVSEMCRKLLANHVIEDVRFQVEKVSGREKAEAASSE